MILPTSGTQSFTVWDATETTVLEHWLEANLDQGVKHEAFEVVEDFSLGIGSILSQRGNEKMHERTRQAMHAAGNQAAKVKSSAVFQKMATTASKAKTKAMESPAITQAANTVNQGWQASLKSMEKGIDWAKQKFTKGGSPPPNPAYPAGAPAPVSHPNPMIPVYPDVAGQNPVYAGSNQTAGGEGGVGSNTPSGRDIGSQPQAPGPVSAPRGGGPQQNPHSVSPNAVFSLDDADGDGENPNQSAAS